MFDIIHDLDSNETARLEPLRAFADEHRYALLDAAAVLGGRGGARLARSVLDGLAGGERPSRRLRREVDDLLDLLMLEHVHDVSREEAGRFVAIDPANPCVEEICLLADGPRAAIKQCETHKLHELSSLRERIGA